MEPERSPSSISRRLPAAALALIGCAIACYLGGYQLGWLRSVWDPMFGDGSARILHSSVATLLPIPDALVGAGAYLLECCLELMGGEDRWSTHPLLTTCNMLLVCAMALGSLGLVFAQPLLFGAWCTLCLVSAACSFAVLAFSWDEVRATAEMWSAAKKTT